MKCNAFEVQALCLFFAIITIPETNIAPGNGSLEYDRFLLGFGLFQGRLLLVSGSVRPLFCHKCNPGTPALAIHLNPNGHYMKAIVIDGNWRFG